jgi:DNA-binding CsgD family transcriptional regulator
VGKRGRPPRLDQAKERSLLDDLLRGPRAFRYSATVWSGALLATHLARRYRLTMSDRAGRRMLRKLIPNAHTPQRVLRSTDAGTRVISRSLGLELSPRPFPASDALNKERALRRIKRLAASGLPLEPFVMTMFALVGNGVPNSETKLFLPDSDRPIGFMVNASEVVAYHEAYERYFIRGSPEQSGNKLKFDSNTYRELSSRATWSQEEFLLPHYYRSEGFNEVMRPLRLHHQVSVRCSDEGEPVAFYPVWRGPDQKQFSRDDISFLQACAPHLAHGFRIASLLAEKSVVTDSSEFVALPQWTTGVVLTDQRGRVVSIDDAARAIFTELALFEAAPTDPVLPARVGDSLSHIANCVKGVLGNEADPCASKGAPVVRIYSHGSGIVLKLRAARAWEIDGATDQIAVLIERGEFRDQRQRRLMYRWGLNNTELAIVEALRRDLMMREAAAAIGVSGGTLKTYVRRLSDKLGIEGIFVLRRFAHKEF